MNVKEIYNNYWSSGLHPDPHWSEYRIKKEFDYIWGCQSILDYGCGLIPRKYGDVLSKNCGKYVGADVSHKVLEINRSAGFDCVEINASTGSVDFPDGHFEGVVCCEVFEHIYDPLSAAKELNRLLCPGGKLIAMVPNFGYHAWRLQAMLRADVPHEPENSKINAFNGVHIRYFGVRTFGRLLKAAGFSTVKIMPYDYSSIWDVFRGLGKLCVVSDVSRKYFHPAFHLNWLQFVWPNLFAMRLKAIAFK